MKLRLGLGVGLEGVGRHHVCAELAGLALRQAEGAARDGGVAVERNGRCRAVVEARRRGAVESRVQPPLLLRQVRVRRDAAHVPRAHPLGPHRRVVDAVGVEVRPARG